MPIYEYSCPNCGTFETVQRITESPLKRCPTCKSAVERMVSRTSFILKGSGWYATDYGRSGKSGSGSNSESSAGNGASAKPAEGSPAGKASTDKSASSGSGEKGTPSK